MKSNGLLIIIIVLSLLIPCAVFAQARKQTANPAPFSKGVNFAGWFEYVNNAQQINFSKFVEQDFVDAKSLGMDVIRLPIDFDVFTSSAPNYTIAPLLFMFLDQAVDWAEKHQLYIILDNHPLGQPKIDNSIRNYLLQLWRQIAERYKNRSEYVVYEILNEPQGISTRDLGRIQDDVIKEIRKIDQNKWIVVGGSNWNHIDELNALPRFTDNKLIYTFHFYDPAIFTHMGAIWMLPAYKWPLQELKNIPFPYNKNRMPSFPNGLRGSFFEDQYKNYSNIGTISAIIKQLDKVANFAKQRNVPVFCGEFGVILWYASPADRVRWFQVVREAFEERNISWTMFEYFNHNGIYNSQIKETFDAGVVGYFHWQSWGNFNENLNVEVVKALGLNPPPQRQRTQSRSDIIIYDDYFGRGMFAQAHGPNPKNNILNFYYKPAATGEHCIQWGNLNQFDQIYICTPVNDLTWHVQNGYVLELKVKTDRPVTLQTGFDSVQENIPWELRSNELKIQPDNNWQTIRIPLRDIQIWGYWNDIISQWISSPRTPIWTNISRFVISVTEAVNFEFYLDDIRITR